MLCQQLSFKQRSKRSTPVSSLHAMQVMSGDACRLAEQELCMGTSVRMHGLQAWQHCLQDVHTWPK